MAVALVLAAVTGSYEIYAIGRGPGVYTNAVPSAFTIDGKNIPFTYTATTPAERMTGLMNRKITNATTMLFAFPAADKWQFWMYDTNTSLDMIWVNATGDSGVVVYLVTSAPPCYNSISCSVYTPTAAANYVIEAKSGFAAANGIAIGTAIQFT